MNELNELIGKYINGFFITKVEKDPFVKDQINLWTDSTKGDFLGNREVVKFYVRDYPSGASVYQEQVDKENYQLKSILNELEKWASNNYYINGDEVLKKIKELKGSGSNE